MFRLILLSIIGYLIYSFWRRTMNRYNNVREGFQKREPAPEKKVTGSVSELVQDPVCKLYIAKGTAINYKDHYFCSEKCRSEFK